MRMLGRFLAAVLLGVALASAPVAARAASEPNPIGKIQLFYDDGPAPVPRAAEPITFTATTGFTPNKGGSAWLIYVWDFGDGSRVESPRIDGVSGAPIVHETRNTYLAAGTYTVRCTAYHGFGLLGYRFSKTLTRKIQIGCAGSSPGTDKCGAPAYEPFTGTFTLDDEESTPENPVEPFAKLDLQQSGREITGTVEFPVEYTGLETRMLVRGRVLPGLGLNARLTLSTEGTATKARALSSPTLNLEIQGAKDRDGLAPYRNGAYTMRWTHEESGNRFDAASTLFQSSPTTPDLSRQTTICASVKAGKKSISPGGGLVFTVRLQSSGPACIPQGRLLLTVRVTGGTIDERTVKVARLTVPDVGEQSMTFSPDSLGAGAPADGRAALVFLVDTDEDADEVECAVGFTDFPQNDIPGAATVVLPADLKICVPVRR